MKILILGGNRFVGKRVAQALKEQKHEVDLLNRSSGNIRVDRNNPQALEKAVEGKTWDWILDFSCYTGKAAGEACDIFENKTKQYLYISTQSVYRAGADIDESGGGPSPNDYARAKFEAEIEFSENAHWPVAMVRFPIILGLDDYTKRLHFHVERVKKGEPIYFPNLDAKISFVQSADAANFIIHLMNHPIDGAVNCASADPVALRQVMEWVESAVGKKANYATVSTPETHSPFGIEQDWWMNVQKMESLGFKTAVCGEWLPKLVNALAAGDNN